LLKVVPAEFRQHAHHWLILHGRYICKARLPDCPVCPVRELCAYPAKTTADEQGASRTKASGAPAGTARKKTAPAPRTGSRRGRKTERV
jgi:adenine-specific DNA glycosylase